MRLSRLVYRAAMVALAALAVGAPAGAQTVGAGLSLGVNLSEINVSGNELLNVAFTDKIEPALGGFVYMPLGRQATFEVHGLLSVKGSVLDIDGEHARIRLTYIDVPVLLRYAGPANSRMRIHLLGGPYMAFLVDATTRDAAGLTADAGDAFASFDAGWIAGLGVSVGAVGFDARYSGGITDIARDAHLGDLVPGTDPMPTTYRNRGFTFIGTYRF